MPLTDAPVAARRRVFYSNSISNGPVRSQFTSMAHDGAGNRTGMTASLPGYPSYSGLTGYSYDGKDQLLQGQSARQGGYTHRFGYDMAGNPTRTGSPASARPWRRAFGKRAWTHVESVSTWSGRAAEGRNGAPGRLSARVGRSWLLPEDLLKSATEG